MSEANDHPTEVASILQARAEAAARQPEHGPATEPTLEVIEFALAEERYAIESRLVEGVYPLRELTPLPCVPPFLAGVVNVRGRIVAVIDLKRFFDLPEQGITDLHRVIIARRGEIEAGILADRVLGLRRVTLSAMAASLPTLTAVRQEYLKGVTADRLIVIDAGRVLGDPKLVVHEEVEV